MSTLLPPILRLSGNCGPQPSSLQLYTHEHGYDYVPRPHARPIELVYGNLIQTHPRKFAAFITFIRTLSKKEAYFLIFSEKKSLQIALGPCACVQEHRESGDDIYKYLQGAGGVVRFPSG